MLTCCDVETGLVWSGLFMVESGDVLDGVRDHFSKMETLLLAPGRPGPGENTRLESELVVDGLGHTWMDKTLLLLFSLFS